MFFLFLPISSFGRYRTRVPLRGTLLPIVQGIHWRYLRVRQRVGIIVLLRPDGGFSGLSEVLQPLLALNTFGLQVQQLSEFLSVMLRQWHVIRSRPR